MFVRAVLAVVRKVLIERVRGDGGSHSECLNMNDWEN